MKKYQLLVFTIITSFIISCQAASLNAPKTDRDNILHQPITLNPNAKTPLVIVLHGGLGRADSISKTLQMNPIADQNGFLVAYLNGTGGHRSDMQNKRTWNAGTCCGAAKRRNIDDVAYISRFIDDMVANKNVDPNNISLIGYSNGAMMSYRFVCEKPGRVQNLIAIAGPLEIDQCNAQNLKVLHIHGKEDDHVLYQGGSGFNSLTGIDYRSIAETKQLVENNSVSFKTELLDGTGHNIVDIRNAIRIKHSLSLAQYIAEFIAR